MRWDKNKTNPFKILYNHGGIFVNNIQPLQNFYSDLVGYRFNIWEQKINDKYTFSLDFMACERNFPGCKIMDNELKRLSMLEVFGKYFKEENDAFNVISWNNKKFRKQ